ncbi:MAG: type 4b pilus Flp biogenesis protein TadZ [Methylohalobius crimeensis]
MTTSIPRKRSFVAVTDRPEYTRWLHGILKDEGELLTADQPSLERVCQIIDLTGAQLVFVALAPQTLRHDTALLEGLVAIKPLLGVVAMADQADSQLLLAAMRAGAKDFITPQTRPGDVINLVHRIQERSPAPSAAAPSIGSLTALISARPGTDTPMLALHLALAMQNRESKRDTLLLDLGSPPGDSLLYLGINASYSFIDAVRSLRRLDSVLIDSAFAKHHSGLHLLALPEDADAIGEITSADIYVLLGMLRRYFSRIVVNLGGVPWSDFLYLLLSNADDILVVIEQSVPSCKQNMQLVREVREHKISMDSVGLVVDRYLPKLPPDTASLSRGFDLPVHATLPPSGMARLNMMNSGESLFECAPRDPYTTAVRNLAAKLTADKEADGKNAEGIGRLIKAAGGWLGGRKK